ncbi:MAG: glycosyltransferase, partial [Terriglobia bacterium]
MIRTRNKLRDRLTRLLSRGDHLAYAKAKAHEKEKLQRVAQSTRWKDFILEWAFSFPDPECSWFRPAVRNLHLPTSEDPDVVFATGGPWTCLLVGQTLARRLQVPFVADFRDPWTANPYYALPSRFLFGKARRLERALCDAATRVIANTEELRRRFAFDYPDFAHKFVTITNGYNSDVSEPSIRHQEPSDEAGLELSYFGTLYGNGNPLPLLQAVMELVEANGLRSDQFRLRFVGSWEIVDDRCERLARKLEKQGFLRREPPVPHHLCLEQMRQANVLLIMQ